MCPLLCYINGAGKGLPIGLKGFMMFKRTVEFHSDYSENYSEIQKNFIGNGRNLNIIFPFSLKKQ